jgi:hypothetical protein
MEGVVLTLTCLSPWAFGAGESLFELCLYAGVALLLLLWGLRMLLEGRLTWKRSPLALCLAGLFLIGIWQLAPLPRPVLQVLSPGTPRLYDKLLPSQPEMLPSGAEQQAPAVPAGTTLSLYPTATRLELVRVLAVLLLFAVVRNNIASPAALRRLGIVALANGTLLALFGFIQFFSSPPGLLYWTFPTPGSVFGPFINRNHFAFYMNLCVGLGLGLLRMPSGADSVRTEKGPRHSEASAPGRESSAPAERSPERRRHRSRRRRRSRAPQEYQPVDAKPGLSWSPLAVLQQPRKLWVILPLTLMVSSMLFSVSRGAFVAGIVAGALCLLIHVLRSRRFTRVGILAMLSLVLVSGLLFWFGFERVTARLATLGEEKALRASRVPLWGNVLPLVEDFPVWGTGLGTFTHVESLHRHDPELAGVAYEHAHNEYLELLIEQGVVGLLVGLLALGLLLWFAYRAATRPRSPSTRVLAMGALFALTATAVHSFVEFGLHIPAIAWLMTVIAAQVCGLAAADGQAPSNGEAPPDGLAGYTLRLWGLAPLLGAATAVVLGLVLCAEGLQAHLVQRLLAAASQAKANGDEPLARQHQLAYLEAAAVLAPEYANLQFELAQAHLEAIEEQQRQTMLVGGANLAVQETLLPALAADGPFPAPLARACTPFGSATELVAVGLRQKEEEAEREHLVPGLQHCLLARDLCPTLARAQVRLADYADRLQGGAARGAYLERAKLLVSFDPEIWYFCGLQELLDDQPDQAWDSWRHSLDLSAQRLPDIALRSAAVLPPTEVRDRVIPDKPDLLYEAALVLYPDPGATPLDGPGQLKRTPHRWAASLFLASIPAGTSPALPAGVSSVAQALEQGYLPVGARRPFLDKALALLEQKPGPLEARDLHQKAQVFWALWQLKQATATYQEALAQDGLNVEWRYEYAKLLYQQGRLKDAKDELYLVLGLPSHPGEARDLLEIVTLERARTEDILK